MTTLPQALVGKGTKPKGEAFVWLTSMGLALGLVMVAFLLIVIFKNGLTVFWPKRLAKVETVDGREILGEVILKQTKRVYEEGEMQNVHEWQLFRANKPTYGSTFVFVEEKKIKEITYPESAMKIERTGDGYAIGWPVKMTLEDGTVFDAPEPGFREKLHARIEEATERREEIKAIRKVEIGRKINNEIEARNIKLRGLERDGKGDSARAEEYRKEIQALRDKYTRLTEEANEMEDELMGMTLTLKQAGGHLVEVPIGKIIHVTHSNRMGFFARVGTSIRNLWRFIVDDPREANQEGGIFPAIFGTFVMTIMMSLFVTPFGVIAAVYMHEYAKNGIMLRLVRIAVNNLAGVPSIVFGVFGLGFFVYFMGGSIDSLFFRDRGGATFGEGGVLWASLTLALLTLPVVIVAAEEALSAVPRGMREASLAMGATKWQTIYRIVSPAALPGIITGMILAMARGAGEVAPLMLVGVVKMAPELPVNLNWPFIHLDQKFMHLGFHIYDLGFQSPDSEAARPMLFATTVLLITLVVVMNLAGIVIRERLRKKYAAGIF